MKILQYNVFGVPFGSFNIKQRHRNICVNLKELIKSVDVIVLCEVFTDFSRDLFTNFFRENNWNSVASHSTNSFFTISGGLMVASKYNFEHSEHTTFKNCKFIDCLAFKGFLSVILNFEGKYVNVIATHMQDETWDKDSLCRQKQVDAIAENISDMPTVIIGDFNIRMNSQLFQYAKKMLGQFHTSPGETHAEGALDYAFFRNAHVCDCTVTQFYNSKGKPLSDHKAVITTLII